MMLSFGERFATTDRKAHATREAQAYRSIERG
jgi:hypothetical protein